MSDEWGKFNWITALVVSVALHVVVVGAWVWLGHAVPSAPAVEADEMPSATNAAPPSVVAPAPSETPREGAPAVKKPSDATLRPKAKPAAGKAGKALPPETAVHVVKKGENLTKIAQAHGLTLKELEALNKDVLKKNHALWVGLKLKVPKPATHTGAE